MNEQANEAMNELLFLSYKGDEYKHPDISKIAECMGDGDEITANVIRIVWEDEEGEEAEAVYIFDDDHFSYLAETENEAMLAEEVNAGEWEDFWEDDKENKLIPQAPEPDYLSRYWLWKSLARDLAGDSNLIGDEDDYDLTMWSADVCIHRGQDEEWDWSINEW